VWVKEKDAAYLLQALKPQEKPLNSGRATTSDSGLDATWWGDMIVVAVGVR